MRGAKPTGSKPAAALPHGSPVALLKGREVIVEIIDRGAFFSVAAIDATTGVEAVASGPSHALEADVERLAVGKLARRLQSLGLVESPTARDSTTRGAKPGGSDRGLLI